ncbi:MAG: hypothetical protein JNK40_00250 [Chromatiales bacterium]|nr:hypothetical protein [Chromatiales bacterium]
MRHSIIRSLATCLLLLPVAGWAAPLQWTLANVVFNDGGDASGSFTYDADTNTYSLIAITTTAGTAFGGATYSGQNLQPGTMTSTQLVALPFDTINPSLGFILRYVNPLTNAGGTVNLVPGFVAFPITFGSGETVYFGGPLREVVSGAVSAAVVPLPAAGPLFIAGCALLGLGSRRRRSSPP